MVSRRHSQNSAGNAGCCYSQIVVLPRAEGMDWLNLAKPEAEILRPLPKGSLTHAQVR